VQEADDILAMLDKLEDRLDNHQAAVSKEVTQTKKRGRPAGAQKPKAAEAKPRWRIAPYQVDDMFAILCDVAALLEPQALRAQNMRTAVDLFEMIEKAK
jgi:hypothetical protein